MSQEEMFDLDSAELTGLLEHAAVTADARAWPKMLTDLIDLLTAHFKRRGFARPDEEARRVVAALAVYFGGRMMYLPRGDRLQKAMRDAEIWAAYTGNNVPQLAQHFRMSVPSVYAIIAEQRALRVRAAQPSLFPASDQ